MSVSGFVVVDRFDASDASWANYIAWSGLTQLTALVSLDCILCGATLHPNTDGYWEHVVDPRFALFDDLAWLVRVAPPTAQQQLLFVRIDPAEHEAGVDGFVFAGFDLVEAGGGVSSLSNCGGWPGVLDNAELNAHGLLSTWTRARAVQQALQQQHPQEPHAQTTLLALWMSRCAADV